MVFRDSVIFGAVEKFEQQLREFVNVKSKIIKMSKVTVFLLCFFPFLMTYGQDVKIAKKTKIVMSYNYKNMEGGGAYFSKKPVVKNDTTVSEFDDKGVLKGDSINSEVSIGKFVKRDSIVLVSMVNTLKHEREYRSDSTIYEIYTHDYGDSIVKVKLSKKDTVEINKSYLNNGKLVKSYSRYFTDNYVKESVITLFEVNTKNRVKKTVITTYNSRSIDTIKTDYKRINRSMKTLHYNPYEKEWYLTSKTKSKKNKRVIWKTFYHDDHRRYFIIKFTIRYNELGLPVSETAYDMYLKRIDRKIIFKYEYY